MSNNPRITSLISSLVDTKGKITKLYTDPHMDSTAMIQTTIPLREALFSAISSFYSLEKDVSASKKIILHMKHIFTCELDSRDLIQALHIGTINQLLGVLENPLEKDKILTVTHSSHMLKEEIVEIKKKIENYVGELDVTTQKLAAKLCRQLQINPILSPDDKQRVKTQLLFITSNLKQLHQVFSEDESSISLEEKNEEPKHTVDPTTIDRRTGRIKNDDFA
ncbi:MAG: hypothetical protein WCL02_06320 [bacterium]